MKYFIYAGCFENDMENKGIFDFNSDEEAEEFAKSLAKKIYDQDPLRTVEDIMFEDEVELQEATEIYELEKLDEINYFVDPIENGDEDEDDESEIETIWYEIKNKVEK